jgi:FkbM family methyltransferase
VIGFSPWSGRGRRHRIGALVGMASAWLVQRSYRQREGFAHRWIQAIGCRWYGLRKTHPRCRLLCSHLKDSLCSAQAALFHAGQLKISELGPAPIGFAGLKVRCSTSNINSALIYLLGFSDNLAMFEVYRRFAAPGTVAIDVGANMGAHSLALSACVGEHGKVVAFEPAAFLVDKLRENLALNHAHNVEARTLAVGSVCGPARLQWDPNEFNIGKGRIDERGNEPIFCSTIDLELRGLTLPVSLIKIDTEGHELEVLKGAVGLIEEQRPVVVMEFNPSEYSLEDVRNRIPQRYAFFELAEYPDKGAMPIDIRLHHRCDLLIAPCERL